MPDLVYPTTTVHLSFLTAMAEFQAEGRGRIGDRTSIGREIAEFADTWASPGGFAAYVDTLRAEELEDTTRPTGAVPQSTRWYVEGAEYLGRVGIRHRLTPFLRDIGGHIGYDVRPSARRRGHATRMLRLALPVVYQFGIDSVLVTCDTDNVASRKVIEGAGGVLEDQRGDKLRFWVDTPSDGPASDGPASDGPARR